MTSCWAKPAEGQAARGESEAMQWARETLPTLETDFSLLEVRQIDSYERVAALSAVLKQKRQRVVLTSGSFDIIHEGHSMYLEAARRYGDFLFVGVDSDEKIRQRKGPGRPAVPEMERLRMVAHQRGVGAVVLKRPDDEKWSLVAAVRPTTLVATEETYTPSEIQQLEGAYCGHVQVLARMATVSTSARLRLMQFEALRRSELKIRGDVSAAVDAVIEDATATSGSAGPGRVQLEASDRSRGKLTGEDSARLRAALHEAINDAMGEFLKTLSRQEERLF